MNFPNNLLWIYEVKMGLLSSILFLLVASSNQGHVHHVQGPMTLTTSPPLTHGQQQYASFEELQKLVDNPFENNTAVNLTVPLGGTAYLRCKVRHLGERTISWIRRRDWHILTSGTATYTNDERFVSLHQDGSDDWTLMIKFVQKRDDGTYECQVSTGGGIASFFVHLHIAVPEAFILGNGEYHIEQGSTITLVCIIENSPVVPDFIFWYHNEVMVSFGGSGRGLVVATEPGNKVQSRLTIHHATITDGGNYSCTAAHVANPASTLLYVSSGDKIAASQNRGRSSGESSDDGSAAVTSNKSSISILSSFSDYLLLSSMLIPILISDIIVTKF